METPCLLTFFFLSSSVLSVTYERYQVYFLIAYQGIIITPVLSALKERVLPFFSQVSSFHFLLAFAS